MIERILQFSLQNRILVVLLTAVIASFGFYSLRHLPIDAVPDITNNQVQINTHAPALSPDEIEKQVTYPIETSLTGIPGLKSTRSLSRNGFSQVTAIFNDDVDLYFARQQVSERLADAAESLPDGTDPRMGPITTGLGEIYMWTVEYQNGTDKHRVFNDGQAGLQSDGRYLTPEGQFLRPGHEQSGYLRTVADWIIRPQMKTVPGIADIDAIGGYVQQYHIMPDPEKLLALGLSFADVLDVVRRNNQSIGAGFIQQNGEAYVARSDGRIQNTDQLATIVITIRDGIPIYLKDVADIGLGQEQRTGSASENGREVVVGTAMMLTKANSRIVADAVDKRLKDVNKSLPPGIVAKPVLNRAKLVDSTIATVRKNLVEGAILVIAVLFLFLGNMRAALITAPVIPVSMLMTAIGMQHLGISGNLMSLGALDFGLIVDGAVIITENCLRRLAQRQHQTGRHLTLSERLTDVSIATREMIQPTVFGQAIIMIVYIPLLTLSGVEGKMFEPMAVTVILALIAAFILSLTFVPAMIALFVTGKVDETDNKAVSSIKNWYEPLLRRSVRMPLPVIAASIAVVSISLYVFSIMGQEFIPTLDEKDIAMHAMRIPSTSLDQSQELQFAVEKAISAIPEVSFVFSKTGTAQMAADPMPPNVSDTFVILKPRVEWPDADLPKTKLIERIAVAVNTVPGSVYEFTQPIQMRFNELISGVRSDVAVQIYGDSFPVMKKTAADIAKTLASIQGASDVKIEQTSGLRMLDIVLDKSAIARYGLNVSEVLDVISIAIGGRQAGMIYQGDRRFEVVVRLPDVLRNDLDVLRNLPVMLADEDSDPSDQTPNTQHIRPNYVPLKELASFTIGDGPNQISRENGKRRVVIQANIRNRDIGRFVAEAQTAIDQSVDMPPGYWLDWGGQFQNLTEAKQRLSLVMPACLCMIFILLFTALRSAKQALLVFTGVPLALSGGILSLWLCDMPFSISAAVGLIALSGVAVLNGLVMVSRMNQLMHDGLKQSDAVIQGALSRLRPVLMTALVASLGFIPMALATGAGAEVQKPLATVVIGGLITATLLTLFVLPVLYSRFNFKSPAR